MRNTAWVIAFCWANAAVIEGTSSWDQTNNPFPPGKKLLPDIIPDSQSSAMPIAQKPSKRQDTRQLPTLMQQLSFSPGTQPSPRRQMATGPSTSGTTGRSSYPDSKTLSSPRFQSEGQSPPTAFWPPFSPSSDPWPHVAARRSLWKGEDARTALAIVAKGKVADVADAYEVAFRNAHGKPALLRMRLHGKYQAEYAQIIHRFHQQEVRRRKGKQLDDDVQRRINEVTATEIHQHREHQLSVPNNSGLRARLLKAQHSQRGSLEKQFKDILDDKSGHPPFEPYELDEWPCSPEWEMESFMKKQRNSLRQTQKLERRILALYGIDSLWRLTQSSISRQDTV